MPIGPAANIASLTESSTKLIFPAQDDIRTKIPLWMKFYCYEYNTTIQGRVAMQTAGRGGGELPIPGLRSVEKASIFLPAPVNFQTNTAHKYVAESTSSSNMFSNYIGDLVTSLVDSMGLNTEQASVTIKNIISMFENAVGNASGFASELQDLDTNDAMFATVGPSRSYDIRMNLPCLTEADSQAAAKIIRAFEALSLPTIRAIGKENFTKSFHPPLWIFGIGPIDQRVYDQDWSGTPQISVLRTVSHKKTAFETNSLAGIGHNTLLKPVAYTLSLNFLELEPAFRATNLRAETSTTIINRSTAMMTTGTNIHIKSGA